MRAQKMSFWRSCPKDNDLYNCGIIIAFGGRKMKSKQITFSDSHMIGKSHIGEACPKRFLPPKGMILPHVFRFFAPCFIEKSRKYVIF